MKLKQSGGYKASVNTNHTNSPTVFSGAEREPTALTDRQAAQM